MAWVLYGSLGATYFYLGKDVARKRRYYPWFMLFAALVMTASPMLIGERWWVSVLVAVPSFAFALWFIATTVFCDACSAMLLEGVSGTPPTVCRRCGAAFQGGEPGA
jgi:hypothetical protein